MSCQNHVVCSLTEPSLYFGEPEYVVEESSGYVEVKVWRTGTDLSKIATVTVRSKKSDPVSAEGKTFGLTTSMTPSHYDKPPSSSLSFSRTRLCRH